MTAGLARTGLVAGLLLGTALAAQGQTVARVCVGADRVLRYAGAGPCPQGQSEHALVTGQQPGSPDAGTTAQVAELQRKVDFLGKRLADVEREAAGSRGGETFAQKGLKIRAPFEVVDGNDKTIMLIGYEPGGYRGFKVFSAAGQPLLFGSALETGGMTKALGPDQQIQTVTGVNGKFAGMAVRNGATSRAGLALNTDGISEMFVANGAGQTVASVRTTSTNSGKLQLANASGESVVEAGMTPNGVGAVIAYPKGNPGAGLLGLPGTYLVGRR
jgi:hypothetical protein